MSDFRMPTFDVEGPRKEPASDVTSENRELHLALDELLRLSNHYAELLNMHDGGKRRTFENADEWIARLHEIGTLRERKNDDD